MLTMRSKMLISINIFPLTNSALVQLLENAFFLVHQDAAHAPKDTFQDAHPVKLPITFKIQPASAHVKWDFSPLTTNVKNVMLVARNYKTKLFLRGCISLTVCSKCSGTKFLY